MPLLLEEGSKEIEGHCDVLSQLFISHLFITGGDVKLGDFLQLPLDGSSNVINLFGEWFVVGYWLWESSDSVKDWPKNLWDFLNENISGEEKGEFLGPLLDEFLVLVELGELFQ